MSPFRLLAAWLILSGGAAAQEILPVSPLPPFVPETCGPASVAQIVSLPLPTGVSGRVSFYAAEYDPATMHVLNQISLGAVNEVQPIASMFKTLVVEMALRDVDAGRLKLNTPFITTAENRSIEIYPSGTNSLQKLARRSIELSDNTAADILLLDIGPERLTRSVLERSPCNQIFLTGKAAWAAQGGLLSSILGDDLNVGAQQYAAQNLEEKLTTASQMIEAVKQFTGPQVEAAIDLYFRGPQQSHQIDLAFQHSSTAKAFTDLAARVYTGRNLQPATRRVFRAIMALGCCQPKQPKLNFTYWGAKAGSGWRLLALSGVVETPDKRLLAYTYLNDQSGTLEAEDMEKQIRPVLGWIERSLLELLHTR